LAFQPILAYLFNPSERFFIPATDREISAIHKII